MNLESDYTNLRKIMELLDQSPRLYRLAWACVAVAAAYALAAIITAVRWW